MHHGEDLCQWHYLSISQRITSSSSTTPNESENTMARLALHAQTRLQPTSPGRCHVSPNRDVTQAWTFISPFQRPLCQDFSPGRTALSGRPVAPWLDWDDAIPRRRVKYRSRRCVDCSSRLVLLILLYGGARGEGILGATQKTGFNF